MEATVASYLLSVSFAVMAAYVSVRLWRALHLHMKYRDATYYDVCEIWTCDKTQWGIHIMSKGHKRRAKKLKRGHLALQMEMEK